MNQINLHRINYTVLSPYGESIFEVVMVLLVTAGVFVLAWLASRYIARRSIRTRQSGSLQLIERLVLGKDKQIALIKVGCKHYLVGLSQNSIQFSQPVDPGDFASVLLSKNREDKLFDSNIKTTDTNLGSDSDNFNPAINSLQSESKTIGQKIDRCIEVIIQITSRTIAFFQWRHRWAAKQQMHDQQDELKQRGHDDE